MSGCWILGAGGGRSAGGIGADFLIWKSIGVSAEGSRICGPRRRRNPSSFPALERRWEGGEVSDHLPEVVEL